MLFYSGFTTISANPCTWVSRRQSIDARSFWEPETVGTNFSISVTVSSFCTSLTDRTRIYTYWKLFTLNTFYHHLSWNENAVKHWKSYPCSIFLTLCIPSPSIRNKTFFNTCESGFWNVILTVNSLPTTASSRGWNSTNTINGCRMKRERDLRARTEGMNFDVVCSSHKQSCDFRRHGI